MTSKAMGLRKYQLFRFNSVRMRIFGNWFKLLILSFAVSLASCAELQNEFENRRDITHTRVIGSDLHLSGTLNTRSYREIQNLLNSNPQINRLIMHIVDGSIDDITTLDIGVLIHQRGLDTHVHRNSEIDSGAVDLYLAGRRRTAEYGAHFGVHSWGGIHGEEGRYFPADHPDHEPYLEYFSLIGAHPDFYWFTLNVAGANEIHAMTTEELIRYGVVHEFVTRPDL